MRATKVDIDPFFLLLTAREAFAKLWNAYAGKEDESANYEGRIQWIRDELHRELPGLEVAMQQLEGRAVGYFRNRLRPENRRGLTGLIPAGLTMQAPADDSWHRIATPARWPTS